MSKENEPKSKFGQAVRRRRQILNMSQEDLAARAHIHVTYLSSVERGHRNLALINIVSIAHALEVTCSELMCLADL